MDVGPEVSRSALPSRLGALPAFTGAQDASGTATATDPATITLIPPPPSPPPPKPAPRPTPWSEPSPLAEAVRPIGSSTRSSAAKVSLLALGLVAGTLVPVIVFTALGSLFSALRSGELNSGPATPSVPPSAPCPTAVAQWLPGGESAELVARYTTARHVVTVCRVGNGQLYYDGQARGAPADAQNHIVVKATETGDGFLATNGSYRYRISGRVLTVTENGRLLARWPLTLAGS